jgi:CubicO group peptidase (beta-lactamase class C family)
MKLNPVLLCLLACLFISVNYPQNKAVNNTFTHELSQCSSPEEAGFSSERLKRIDRFFESQIKNGMLPHAQVFIARHGKIVLHKSYGWKNIAKKEALQNSDIFRLASQTKAVTTVALMTLYEEGAFRLDDPVSDYIPEFKNPKVAKEQPADAYSINPPKLKSEITIRNLLSHTSGIPYYDYKIFDNMATGLTMEDKTLAMEIPKLAALPLEHRPGTGFTYGYSLDVCGYLIEKLSGMSLNEYFTKKIFEPLGMKDTYFYLPEDKADRLITLYKKDNASSAIEPSTETIYCDYPVKGAKKFYSGGAGLVGPIEDYAKLCQMLLNKGIYNGKRILSPKTVELMTVNQIGELKVWDSGNKFGLGFEIMTDEGLKNILGSVGSYKWGGMFGTEYIIDPKEDMTLIFYCNLVTSGLITETLNKYRNLVYQALTEE